MALVSVTYILKYAGGHFGYLFQCCLPASHWHCRLPSLQSPSAPPLSPHHPHRPLLSSLPVENQNVVVMDLVQAAPLAASHLIPLLPLSSPSLSLYTSSPSCTTFCCCYAPWNWFISVLRQMQSTKFQKKENKKKNWKLFIPPTVGLEAVWAWPAASWLPSSCCCCCCYCWQFVSLILMLSNYIARAQGLDSGQESAAQVEARASAPAAATRPSH